MSGGITSWFLGSSQLDEAVDKATSELLPSGSDDIALNLEICDQIRSKSVPAKDAMKALKRRLNHKNPNVQLLTLGLTDTCVKNGGDQFLTEVASREFMDNLVSILKIPALNLDVKNTILRLVQNWSVAFEGKPSLGYVGQVYRTLMNEGFKFPPKDMAVANSAMVDTQTAPEWIDSDVCLRCRTAFSFTNRKHHCRNCGQVFDQQCSSKGLPLPHFGITQEVRVCDGCFNKLTRKTESHKPQRQPAHVQPARHRPARELDDAELQRAIQLSLEEASSAKRGYTPSQPPSSFYYSEPPIVDQPRVRFADEEDDPELRAAIEASLREASAPKPSAPVSLEGPRFEAQPSYYQESQRVQTTPVPNATLPQLPNYDMDPLETDTILTFSQTIEQVQAQGGRDLSRYPAVTELYDKANGLRPKLALSLDDTNRKEEMLADMHTKLSEAVQLYDKLLTEQLAYPRWRAPQVATPLYHQPTDSAPASRQPVAWEYAQSPSSPQVQVSPPAPISTFQPSYQPEAAQPQWSQPQYAQSTQPYAPPSEHLPPVSVPYAHADYPQYSSQPIPPPPSVVPPVQAHIPPPPPLPITPMSPPIQPSVLSRRTTMAHAPSPAPHVQLSRSSTVTHPQAQVHRPPVQPQYLMSPPTLPQFPSAPTTIPQGYGYGIGSSIAHTEERKEALLIDL
ncbi:ubiquitin binding protein [Pluteus cervinus]|uniref:Ubiquitin binding protein n=1 Tax=Pluteus cervinus TaxID=181527 RepID=A0ACD3B2B1_9AGAR|nr:ubiquitin binding protein [Pluteus cervinus]